MSNRLQEALIALRQIQRRTEEASRRLASTAKLTPSQFKVLQLLSDNGALTAGDLSTRTFLKHATITSLLDRLEERRMISRSRSEEDRRKVIVHLEPDGGRALCRAPDLLQDQFSQRFEALQDWEKGMIVAALEKVSSMLDAENMEVAPVLDVGELDEKPF